MRMSCQAFGLSPLVAFVAAWQEQHPETTPVEFGPLEKIAGWALGSGQGGSDDELTLWRGTDARDSLDQHREGGMLS